MCGRYFFNGKRPAAVQENEAGDALRQLEKCTSGEVYPGQSVRAINLADGVCRIYDMRWGFDGPGGINVINARYEDMHGRNMFRYIADRQRCVVPASHYYEWRRGDGQKFAIRPKDNDDPFFLAGLYRCDGRGDLRFVILTQPAGESISLIHDRMPVMFTGQRDVRKWLSNADMPIDRLNRLPLIASAVGDEQLTMLF